MKTGEAYQESKPDPALLAPPSVRKEQLRTVSNLFLASGNDIEARFSAGGVGCAPSMLGWEYYEVARMITSGPQREFWGVRACFEGEGRVGRNVDTVPREEPYNLMSPVLSSFFFSTVLCHCYFSSTLSLPRPLVPLCFLIHCLSVSPLPPSLAPLLLPTTLILFSLWPTLALSIAYSPSQYWGGWAQ